jgi:hypothetical protein
MDRESGGVNASAIVFCRVLLPCSTPRRIAKGIIAKGRNGIQLIDDAVV